MAKKEEEGAPPKAKAPREFNRDKNGRFTKAEKPRPTRRAQPAEDDPEDNDDSAGESLRTDLGPWAETPNSTRVSAYRYDYMKNETQVTWRNNGNAGYAYSGMSYEDFRRFARVASKGKYINSTLNGFGYRRLTPDEVQAPSNRDRRAVSRARA
jgi:hypothetical protein